MRKPNLPYLDIKSIKGKTYIYFRRGSVSKRLPDNPDTEEFSREYWAIRSGKRKDAPKTNWNALIISYYQNPSFTRLSKGTQANYRRHCEEIRLKNGDKDVRSFRRKHALAARDALQATWSKANERVAVLSVLCRHAVDLEWIERNPVEDIAKLEGGEYEPWPADMLMAFERACDEIGQKTARAIYELGIGTGQRLGDCIAMQWSDFDGEYMAVVQEKTGVKIWIYCPARLRNYLATLPKAGQHILSKTATDPLGKRAVQKAVEEVRDKIGARHGANRLVIHGWRYTAAVQLSDAGCSDAEIQAVTGHKTLEMVRKYRAQADQKQASKRAQLRREQKESET